jgi:hypothetical protein
MTEVRKNQSVNMKGGVIDKIDVYEGKHTMHLLKQICICTLILILCAGQAAAFDIQIGHLDFGPPIADTAGRYQADNKNFGAMISIPLGFSESGIPATP